MAHGIMFHHFHDDSRHIRCQGSIDAGQLEAIYSLQHKIKNDELNVLGALKQDLAANVRVSKRKDFNDAVAEQYMNSIVSPDQIYERLVK